MDKENNKNGLESGINQNSLEKVAKFKEICKEFKIEITNITISQIIKDSLKSNKVIDFKVFFERVVGAGIMSEEKMTEILAKMDNTDYYDYFSQHDDVFVKDVLRHFKPDAYSIFREHFFVPIKIDFENKILHFGMKNPSNVFAREKISEVIKLFLHIKEQFSYTYKCYTMSVSAIFDYFFHYLKTITDQDLYVAMSHIVINTITNDDTERAKSIMDFTQKLLAKAIYEGVSDIHFEPNEKIGRIKFRKDGVLIPMLSMDIDKYANIVQSIALACSATVDTIKKEPMDGRIEEKKEVEGGAGILTLLKINYEIDNVDFRVSFIPNALNNPTNMANHSVVIRILSRRGGIPSLEKLGFQETIRNEISYVSEMSHGIFLITGPTGSGKSTTLYSVLSRINATEKNIITIEDPVEYRNSMWKQVQINEKATLTFSSAITHFLRHDPDIILVGEMRDVETAKQAIIASNTGHLVLSTLHTNDAPSAISRLTNLGINEFDIINNIVAILAQRLTRIVCPHCAIHRTLKDDDLSWIEKRLKLSLPSKILKTDFENYIPKEVLYANPNGCEFCHYTGYTGRAVISEICLIDRDIRQSVIAKDYDKIVELMLELNPYNMLFLSGLKRVIDHETTINEVRRVI